MTKSNVANDGFTSVEEDAMARVARSVCSIVQVSRELGVLWGVASMSITVLVKNRADSGKKGRQIGQSHGLSFYAALGGTLSRQNAMTALRTRVAIC